MALQKSKVFDLLTGAGALCVLVSGSIAQAHVCMDAPLSRVGGQCTFASDQKDGPCGVEGRGSNVTTFRPGETITVELNETIDHPSHYRIAFNPDGDAFEDPTTKDDKDGKHPFVLLDNITDVSAAKQSIKVTLPNVPCDKCTLQLIQVMYDKGGNGFGGSDGSGGKTDNDDLYYACADIVLKGEPVGGTPPTGADAGSIRDAAAPSTPNVDAGVTARDAASEPPAAEQPSPPTAKLDAGKSSTAKDAGASASTRDAAPREDEDEDEDKDAPAMNTREDGCSLSGAAQPSGNALGVLLALSMLVGRSRKRPR
jgi:hypothetical protein